jgi:hypothetical protein
VLSEQEALDGLSAAEFPTPRTRFENWRERGLIVPCGTRKGLGQGKGRVAHLYPDGTIEQAIEIAQLRRQNLDLDEIGWRLWLAGYPVERRCWFDIFKFMAKRFDACAAAFRESQESDELVDGHIEQIIEAAWKAKKPNRFFSQMRKSLGPKRFAAVMNEVASMATGVFQSISSQQELGNQERLDDERAIDVALGLKHARTDTVAGAGPLLPTEDYSPILQATFEPLERVSLSKYLDRIDPEYLRRTARSLLALLHSIAEASDAFDHALSRDAFGLRRAAMLDCVDRSLHAGMVLVWALVQQRSREKFHDLDAMAQLFLRAAIGARKFLELKKLDPNLKGPEFRRVTYKIRPDK